jgi:hypothetical protein
MFIFTRPPKVRHVEILPGLKLRMPECKLVYTDVPRPLTVKKVLRSK